MSTPNDLNPAEPWLELYDDQVSAQELMDRIAARLAKHPPADAPVFPEYILQTEPPDFPADIPYRFGLYYHLQRANDLYNQAETGANLAPSPATRVPFLGRWWQLIREEAHRLVLYYVNRQASHQAQVNRHLVQTLNELTRQVEAQQRTIQQLEAQLGKEQENQESEEDVKSP